MSQVANHLLHDSFRLEPASRRWIVTPICVSLLVHVLILSSVEDLDLLKAERLDDPIGRLFTIEAGTVSPDDLARIAMAPDLTQNDLFAVTDADTLLAAMFPEYRDTGPRDPLDLKPAPRYPEEELPLVSNPGLSERSRAFVRDGELGVVDPGKARVAYIPRGRKVERTVLGARVSPKLADTPDAFLLGLPGGEPAFLSNRTMRAPALAPPSAAAVSPGSSPGLSERSRAFVRDGELGVVDPGKARVAYIPRGRKVERTVPGARVSPKLADTPDAFLLGLPGGEPAFLSNRTMRAPALAPPSAAAASPGSGPGLSEQSRAFVRDGELGVVDPGKARVAYIPRGRKVVRTVLGARVSPKLADTPDAFLLGLPGGAPAFLSNRTMRGPALAPPSTAAASPGLAATSLGRNAERLLADDGPPVPVKPVELDVKIDVYAEPGGKFRFFRMTVSQRKGAGLPVIAKNVLFVVDISASIRLDMLRSIRRAIGNAAAGFNQGDRFNVIRFSEQHYKEFDGFAPSTADNIALATRGVRKEPGQVRTDVYAVLKDVIASLRASKTDAHRPTNLYVISDGKPTTGLQDIRHIVNDLSAVTKTNYSIFAVNPGAKTANAYLLDLLAYRNRGRFVQAKTPGEADAAILGLLMKFKDPVLTSLRAQYGNFEADQVYPETLPNLYAARPIVIYGRCLPGETIAVRIMGDSATGRRKFLYTSTLPEVSTDDKSIAREWARGKIHHLVSLIARTGEKREVLDEMRQLSERYKLASPFK